MIRFRVHGPTLALTLIGATPLTAQSTAPTDSAKASAMLSDSNFAGAVQVYTALTIREPANPSHWSGLARAHHGLAHWEQSEAASLKALELYPATPPRPRRVTWYNIAAARARQGKADAAMAALDSISTAPLLTTQVLESDPDMASLMSHPRMARLKAQLALAFSPCDTMPKAREFDFWIGDWNVHAPNGQLAGTNLIQKVSNGCALLENWTANGGGGAGKSLNFYNANAGYWQQTWIGAAGGPVEFREGKLEGNTISFIARSSAAGNPIVSRLSFTNLGPNRVRQHAEATTDNGATWTTLYDFQYLRKGSNEKP
jgi:hypothetical protein